MEYCSTVYHFTTKNELECVQNYGRRIIFKKSQTYREENLSEICLTGQLSIKEAKLSSLAFEFQGAVGLSPHTSPH